MEGRGSSYYDQAELWKEPAHYTDDCVRIIEALIPRDVISVLDIGCGNGAITNRLATRFQAIGLDSSREALRHLQGEKLFASSDVIPLKDQSVDLVLLSNVLEHLPEAICIGTVREAMRVARRYLLVVSPHNENLQFSQVKCDDCGCIYHMNHHLRSLTLSDIKQFFGNGFETFAYTFWGDPWPQYDRQLLELKQNLTNGWCRWPLAVCPLCGGKPRAKEPNVWLEKVAALLDDLNDEVLFQHRENLVRQPVESEIAVLFVRTASDTGLKRSMTDCSRQAVAGQQLNGCLLSDKALPESFPSTLKIRLRVKKRIDIHMADGKACHSSGFLHSQTSYLCLDPNAAWGERYLLDGEVVRNYGYSSNPRRHAVFVIPRFTNESFTLTIFYKDMSSEPVWLYVSDKQKGSVLLGQLENKKDGQWKETTFSVPASISPTRDGFRFNLHGELIHRDNFYALTRIAVAGNRDHCLDGTVVTIGSERPWHYLFFSLPVEARLVSDCEWLLEFNTDGPCDQRVQVHLWEGDSFFFVDLLPTQEPHNMSVKIPAWWINQYLERIGLKQAGEIETADRNRELDLIRQELLRKQSELAEAQVILNSRLIRQAVWVKRFLKRLLERTP